ncbi:hypothetical protein HXX76_009784 [Chlamydomonas incerta]|uniref:Uncharacterized protein n=1 Tax=Chlamydomonas incerta TaxID=51695 RepID=A0A835SPG7_CHLIN|nr:hypothetical protein HXX76_009784 [Chlamydomonas incerta]|eukprot:KAG2430808.1 hypothetical protein HXX76_009784 [Chlamydomonas incerta]
MIAEDESHIQKANENGTCELPLELWCQVLRRAGLQAGMALGLSCRLLATELRTLVSHGPSLSRMMLRDGLGTLLVRVLHSRVPEPLQQDPSVMQEAAALVLSAAAARTQQQQRRHGEADAGDGGDGDGDGSSGRGGQEQRCTPPELCLGHTRVPWAILWERTCGAGQALIWHTLDCGPSGHCSCGGTEGNDGSSSSSSSTADSNTPGRLDPLRGMGLAQAPRNPRLRWPVADPQPLRRGWSLPAQRVMLATYWAGVLRQGLREQQQLHGCGQAGKKPPQKGRDRGLRGAGALAPWVDDHWLAHKQGRRLPRLPPGQAAAGLAALLGAVVRLPPGRAPLGGPMQRAQVLAGRGNAGKDVEEHEGEEEEQQEQLRHAAALWRAFHHTLATTSEGTLLQLSAPTTAAAAAGPTTAAAAASGRACRLESLVMEWLLPEEFWQQLTDSRGAPDPPRRGQARDPRAVLAIGATGMYHRAVRWPDRAQGAAAIRLLASARSVGVNAGEDGRTGDGGHAGPGLKVETALHAAAKGGHVQAVRQLLAHPDVDPNVTARRGFTPLHVAAGGGHRAAVRALVADARVDVNAPAKGQATPLHLAALYGQAGTAAVLLACPRVDVHALTSDPPASSVLHAAAQSGSGAVVELLLRDRRIDPEAREGSNGGTALHLAANGGNVEAVSALLADARVDPNSLAGGAMTPLYAAALMGRTAAVEALLADDRVDANGVVGEAVPLLIAACNGHTATVQALLRCPRADPAAPGDEYRCTALHAAARAGQPDTVRSLLADPRVEPNARELRNGATPLHFAADSGHVDIMRVLLEDPRVEPDAAAGEHGTPLHAAARMGRREAARLLLADARVDPNALAEDEATPLRLAAVRGHEQVVELLLADARVTRLPPAVPVPPSLQPGGDAAAAVAAPGRRPALHQLFPNLHTLAISCKRATDYASHLEPHWAHLAGQVLPGLAGLTHLDLSGLAIKLSSTAWHQLATGAAASRRLRRLTAAAAALQHPDAAATAAAEQGGRLAAALPSLAFVSQEARRLRHGGLYAAGSSAGGAGGGSSSTTGVGAASGWPAEWREPTAMGTATAIAVDTAAAAPAAQVGAGVGAGGAGGGITVTVVRGGGGSYLTVRSRAALQGLAQLVRCGGVDGAALVLEPELAAAAEQEQEQQRVEEAAVLLGGWDWRGPAAPTQPGSAVAAAAAADAAAAAGLAGLLAPLCGLRLLHLVSPVNAAPALGALTALEELHLTCPDLGMPHLAALRRCSRLARLALHDLGHPRSLLAAAADTLATLVRDRGAGRPGWEHWGWEGLERGEGDRRSGGHGGGAEPQRGGGGRSPVERDEAGLAYGIIFAGQYGSSSSSGGSGDGDSDGNGNGGGDGDFPWEADEKDRMLLRVLQRALALPQVRCLELSRGGGEGVRAGLRIAALFPGLQKLRAFVVDSASLRGATSLSELTLLLPSAGADSAAHCGSGVGSGTAGSGSSRRAAAADLASLTGLRSLTLEAVAGGTAAWAGAGSSGSSSSTSSGGGGRALPGQVTLAAALEGAAALPQLQRLQLVNMQLQLACELGGLLQPAAPPVQRFAALRCVSLCGSSVSEDVLNAVMELLNSLALESGGAASLAEAAERREARRQLRCRRAGSCSAGGPTPQVEPAGLAGGGGGEVPAEDGADEAAGMEAAGVVLPRMCLELCDGPTVPPVAVAAAVTAAADADGGMRPRRTRGVRGAAAAAVTWEVLRAALEGCPVVDWARVRRCPGLQLQGGAVAIEAAAVAAVAGAGAYPARGPQAGEAGGVDRGEGGGGGFGATAAVVGARAPMQRVSELLLGLEWAP